MSEQSNNWERGVLEKLAMSALQEQRRARHWGIFFKVLTFGYLLILLSLFMGWMGGKTEVTLSGKHTALVDMVGVIAPDSDASADNIIGSLQDAFKDKKTQGVILRTNSPGGSPVQSGYINDEIRLLRAKYPTIPLYVVVEEVCASGCYYVAAAADKIFVNKASLVGSIGVLMDGFGFTGTMAKLGVERRLMTAGENKGFLDPFSPVNAVQQEHAKKILTEIHQQFVDVVLDYWEPVYAPRRGGLVLDPQDFYILASREAVKVPPTHAAEMIAYDTLVGEFRVHYAGFFDPGFGDPSAGGEGSRAVLEVRSYEVPFVIEHGQVVGRLAYERLTAIPDQLYGATNSSYQGQGIKLSKHFKALLPSESRVWNPLCASVPPAL